MASTTPVSAPPATQESPVTIHDIEAPVTDSPQSTPYPLPKESTPTASPQIPYLFPPLSYWSSLAQSNTAPAPLTTNTPPIETPPVTVPDKMSEPAATSSAHTNELLHPSRQLMTIDHLWNQLPNRPITMEDANNFIRINPHIVTSHQINTITNQIDSTLSDSSHPESRHEAKALRTLHKSLDNFHFAVLLQNYLKHDDLNPWPRKQYWRQYAAIFVHQWHVTEPPRADLATALMSMSRVCNTFMHNATKYRPPPQQPGYQNILRAPLRPPQQLYTPHTYQPPSTSSNTPYRPYQPYQRQPERPRFTSTYNQNPYARQYHPFSNTRPYRPPTHQQSTRPQFTPIQNTQVNHKPTEQPPRRPPSITQTQTSRPPTPRPLASQFPTRPRPYQTHAAEYVPDPQTAHDYTNEEAYYTYDYPPEYEPQYEDHNMTYATDTSLEYDPNIHDNPLQVYETPPPTTEETPPEQPQPF